MVGTDEIRCIDNETDSKPFLSRPACEQKQKRKQIRRVVGIIREWSKSRKDTETSHNPVGHKLSRNTFDQQ